MLTKLDPYTSAEFVAQGVTDVNVDIIASGCAGSKIAVSARTSEDMRIPSETHNGVRLWVLPEHVELLDGAQIARAKGKYFLVTKKIQARCGCGTSFSFEKKTVATNLAKLHRLQNILKSSPEIQKFQEMIQTKKVS